MFFIFHKSIKINVDNSRLSYNDGKLKYYLIFSSIIFISYYFQYWFHSYSEYETFLRNYMSFHIKKLKYPYFSLLSYYEFILFLFVRFIHCLKIFVSINKINMKMTSSCNENKTLLLSYIIFYILCFCFSYLLIFIVYKNWNKIS